MGFSACNFKKVLTFHILGARQDESPLLVQILNIQKSVSVLHILPTLFWRCTDMFPNRTYLDARLLGFLDSRSLVDSIGNEEIFVYIFPSIGHPSAVNNVIQAGLNSIIEIIEDFALLGASLNIVIRLLPEGALLTVVWEVGIDWCWFRDIQFCWSFLESGGDCCSSVVTLLGL